MRWRRAQLFVGNARLLWWLVVAASAVDASSVSGPDNVDNDTRSGKGIELFREKKRFKLSDSEQEVLAKVNAKIAQTSDIQQRIKDQDLVDQVLKLSLNVADIDKKEEKEDLTLQDHIPPTQRKEEEESRDETPSTTPGLSQDKTNRGFSSLPKRQRPQRFPFGRDNYDVMGFSAVRAMEEFQLSRTPSKGRVRFENTIANSRRGWIAGESLFQCHVPGLYHFSFSARGGSTRGRWKRSGPRPCFTPSPPLDGVRVVEVDGFRFPWDPNSVRRNDEVDENPGKSDSGGEPIVVDNLRNRYYYNNRLPPGETGDCEDERGGRVPTQHPGGEWRVDLKLNGVTVVTIGGQNGSSASNSVLLQLNERDRVWVELVEGRLIEPHPDSATTSFLGFRISDGRPQPSNEDIFGGDADSIVIENQVTYDYYPTPNQDYYPTPPQAVDEDGNIDMTFADDTFGQQGRPTRPSGPQFEGRPISDFDSRPISDFGSRPISDFDNFNNNRPVNNLDGGFERPINNFGNDYEQFDNRPNIDNDYGSQFGVHLSDSSFLNRPNNGRPPSSVLDARRPSKPRLPIIIETSVGIGPESWPLDRGPPVTPRPPRPLTPRPPSRPFTPRPPRPVTPRPPPVTPRPPRPRPAPTDSTPSGGTHIEFFDRSFREPRRFRKDRAQPTYRG